MIKFFLRSLGMKPASYEVDSLDEIPVIRDWKEDDGFKRLSLNRMDDPPHYVIAEFNNGRPFYVIGYVNKDIPELPTWVYPGKKEIGELKNINETLVKLSTISVDKKMSKSTNTRKTKDNQ